MNDFDRFKIMLAKIKVRNYPCLYLFVNIKQHVKSVKPSIYVASFSFNICKMADDISFMYVTMQKAGVVRQELAKLKKET